ncbi:hypothetical protein B0H13DRAFT_1871156 [Mycena leptocephala]|nr:hypothetical protein B0H13DRAFT_1871156 [Mycena leptocephala]
MSQLASLPQLSSDLIELIIENLDTLVDLWSCNLVCRSWLPLARKRIPMSLYPLVIPGFLDLLQSPTTFLLSTVRHLRIWMPDDYSKTHPQKYLATITMLPTFTRLRLLDIHCNFPVDFCPLPWLTVLKLSGKFASYASFVRFMSDLPALEGLSLSGVEWDDVPDPHLTFPTLQLGWLSLDWGHRLPIEHVMFSLRPRSLSLHVAAPLQEDILSSLNFRHSTSLRRLSIGSALLSLLANIVPHCPLESLILGARTEYNEAPWPPLSQFTELLDESQFAAVREIQFVVDGTVLKDFETQLFAAMRSSAARVGNMYRY